MPLDFDRSALDNVAEYLIFDERNQEGIRKLLRNASNQREETVTTKNAISMPRFLDLSLKELLASDPELTMPRAESGFKASVPFGLRFLMHETDHLFEASKARDLKSIIMDAKPHRSKWVDVGKAGQAELYESLERVITDLKAYTPHSMPFINRVSRREVPDYYDVIKHPMDLNTMLKKLKAFAYTSKADFQSDLDLIYDNCHTYNTSENSPYRANVRELRERWVVLMKMVPEQMDGMDEICDNLVGDGEDGDDKGREESFIPARHPRRMAKNYLHPEFEAFCNSLPDPRRYRFRLPKPHEWPLNPLLLNNIRRIQGIQQCQPSDVGVGNDHAWRIPRILGDKLAREMTDRIAALIAANASVKGISKAAVAVWRDALGRYLVDLVLTPLKRLIDGHSLSLGLEEMLVTVMSERSLTASALRHHVHQQRQYCMDVSALLASITRQKQRLADRTRQGRSHQQQESVDSLQHPLPEDNDYFVMEGETGGVGEEEDSGLATDLPFPLDEFPLPDGGGEVSPFGLESKRRSSFHALNDRVISGSSTPAHLAVESEDLEGEG